ncbi:MAG: discoidin domain-containing protein [Planctomycetes bacterium]|nr:discoidin domain-containing protein [Planctomycetota bacterium]
MLPKLRTRPKYSHRGFSNWSSGKPDKNQWLAIDLRSTMNLSAIGTKGRYDDSKQYVTEYEVFYSRDNQKWMQASGENGTIFIGNYDEQTEVRNEFNRPIRCRYVKIKPLEWVEYITMRVELYK